MSGPYTVRRLGAGTTFPTLVQACRVARKLASVVYDADDRSVADYRYREPSQ